MRSDSPDNERHTFAICAFQESPYLEECIRSLLTQTVSSEIIITTSTDNKYIRGTAGKYRIPVYVNTGEKGIDTAEIIKKAGFGDYAYQIIDGRKKPTNRDHVIALCIAAGMSVKETDRALRLADHYPLSPKDKRDVRLVVCINKGMDKVMDVNLELDKFSLDPL